MKLQWSDSPGFVEKNQLPARRPKLCKNLLGVKNKTLFSVFLPEVTRKSDFYIESEVKNWKVAKV